jgi:tRNA-Thr(GGU) m(6)t(6)A37 methyltransferase TsaA
MSVLAVVTMGLIRGHESEASPAARLSQREKSDKPVGESGALQVEEYLVKPIGFVRSPIKSLLDSPKQGHEGAPTAWLDINPEFSEALEGLQVGQEIIVLTWLHMARRDRLKIHPRRDFSKPIRGIFASRSPHRPNPIGLHQVKILEIDRRHRLNVGPLEVLTGTPIIDLKPVILGVT